MVLSAAHGRAYSQAPDSFFIEALIIVWEAGQVAFSRREAENLSKIGDSYALWRSERGRTTSPTSFIYERASERAGNLSI